MRKSTISMTVRQFLSSLRRQIGMALILVSGLCLATLVETKPEPNSMTAFALAVQAVLAAFAGSLALFLPSNHLPRLQAPRANESEKRRIPFTGWAEVQYPRSEKISMLLMSIVFGGFAAYLGQSGSRKGAFAAAGGLSALAILRFLLLVTRRVRWKRDSLEFWQFWPMGGQVVGSEEVNGVEHRPTGSCIRLRDGRSIFVDYRMEGYLDLISALERWKRK